MPAYSLLIEDDRYPAPTLDFVLSAETDLAELARRLLAQSPHRRKVTFDVGGREVLSLTRDIRGADPRHA
jgi:hypothetical protein